MRNRNKLIVSSGVGGDGLSYCVSVYQDVRLGQLSSRVGTFSKEVLVCYTLSWKLKTVGFIARLFSRFSAHDLENVVSKPVPAGDNLSNR